MMRTLTIYPAKVIMLQLVQIHVSESLDHIVEWVCWVLQVIVNRRPYIKLSCRSVLLGPIVDCVPILTCVDLIDVHIGDSCHVIPIPTIWRRVR